MEQPPRYLVDYQGMSSFIVQLTILKKKLEHGLQSSATYSCSSINYVYRGSCNVSKMHMC